LDSTSDLRSRKVRNWRRSDTVTDVVDRKEKEEDTGPNKQ